MKNRRSNISDSVRKELEFDFNDHTKFIDMETGEEFTTEPWHIISSYKNQISSKYLRETIKF